MRVSVVIPVRDGAAFVTEAVASSLGQSLVPVEVIVVDDGSHDGSATAAEQAGAQVIVQDPLGPGAARNAGASAATGEFVAFLDADDVMTPDRLALQSGWLGQHPNRLGVLGLIQPRQWGRGGWTAPAGAPIPGLLPSALTVRRESFLATGGFDPRLPAGEFVDWLARCRADHEDLAVLDDVVSIRRIHGDNATRDLAGLRSGYLEVARRGIARHRGGPTTESGHPSQAGRP